MNVIESLNNLIVHKAYAGSLGSSLNSAFEEMKNGTVTSEGDLVSLIVRVAVPVAVICVVVLAVYGGYMLMTSQGNPDKLQEGKQVITNAIIGFLVILLCVAILMLISKTLNLGIYS